MVYLRKTEKIRTFLVCFHLPEILLRHRDLEIQNAIVITEPEVFPPLVLTVIGKDGIEEENDAIASQPRQVLPGRRGRNRIPVWRRGAHSRIPKPLVRLDVVSESPLESLRAFRRFTENQ